MLSGDNSIISKAGEARDITGEKAIAERVQIAYLGALATGQGEVTEEGLITALNSEFESGKYILAQDLSKVTIDGKDYAFDGTVSGGGSGSEWKQDSEGKIVSPDGKVKLQIGDYVNYNAIAGVDTTDINNTTIKSNAADNGYGDQTFDLTKYTGDNKWRVLGVKDGKVELISADLVPLSDDSVYFYLKGRTGFQNAETELTKIAGLYGHGTHATGARSVNVDDINKITGYNPNAEGIKNPTAEQIASGNKYGKNKLYEYGNEVTYSWDGTDKPKYEGANGKTGNLSSSHNVTDSSYGNYQNAFSWYDFDTNSWKKSPYTSTATTTSLVEITNLTSTDYYYYPETLTTSDDTTVTTGIVNNSPERDMLFNNTDSKYYWLASRCVYAGSLFAFFCVCFVLYVNVHYYSLAPSYGGGNGGYGVRPVVSLASDIQLEPNGTNAWKFKQ